MTDGIVHPLTGELLEATPPNLYAALVETDERIGEIYALMRPWRQEIARLREALDPVRRGLAEATKVKMPPARYRTPTQERVVHCPRCGDHMEGDE